MTATFLPWEWNQDTAAVLTGRLWLLLLIVWVVMRFSMKTAKQRENPWQYAQHGLMISLGFLLLFTNQTLLPRLNRPLLPQIPLIWESGLALAAFGIAFAIWARLALGANWSGLVTLKKDHELIRKGPYRWIRHPIYTGILLGMLGTVMVRDHLRDWLGIAIVFLAFYFKARREERFLLQEFGAGFEDHARHTGMFLPKLL